MFYDARMTDLHIPADKYYLADAGFPICDALLFLNMVCCIISQNGARPNKVQILLFNVIVVSDIWLQA